MHPDLAALVERPIAHRGLHGCGRAGPIENSTGAATAAIAAGYGIECDVRLSRDGEAMVFHDESLERLTGAPGRFADLDAAALSRLPLGGSSDVIPTLAAFLATIAGRTPLVIEIKSDSNGDLRLIERTLAVVAGYRGSVSIESFDPAVLLHAKTLGATRPIGLVGPLEAEAIPPKDHARSYDFLSWSIEAIDGLRSPLPLTTWTVRTAEQAQRARRRSAQIVFEGFAP